MEVSLIGYLQNLIGYMTRSSSMEDTDYLKMFSWAIHSLIGKTEIQSEGLVSIEEKKQLTGDSMKISMDYHICQISVMDTVNWLSD